MSEQPENRTLAALRRALQTGPAKEARQLITDALLAVIVLLMFRVVITAIDVLIPNGHLKKVLHSLEEYEAVATYAAFSIRAVARWIKAIFEKKDRS